MQIKCRYLQKNLSIMSTDLLEQGSNSPKKRQNVPTPQGWFKPGNTYWLLAQGFAKGNSPKYKPKELLAKVFEYIAWGEANPLWEYKAFANGEIAALPKMRAPTIVGFCNFCAITNTTWTNYCSKAAYLSTTDKIKALIYQQKVEGAAADLLNPSFIGKEIGLAEKTELTGKDGGAIDMNTRLVVLSEVLPDSKTMI